MGKRWRKEKAGQQQKKARKPRGGAGESSAAGATGTMGAFRRGLRAVTGSSDKKGPKGTVEKVIDLSLWVAVALAAAYFFRRQCS